VNFTFTAVIRTQLHQYNGVSVRIRQSCQHTACKDAFSNDIQTDARSNDCPKIGIANDQNATISFNFQLKTLTFSSHRMSQKLTDTSGEVSTGEYFAIQYK
jgi:hypothetical protein